MSWQAISPDVFALGESPFWHPREQTLYWVDIAGKKLLRSPHGGDEVQVWDMPSEPGCIAPAAGGGLVIALRHGVFRARTWAGALEHIVTLDYDPATVRANDGKCDALGRFWVGTIDETKTQRSAALYSIDCRGGAPVVQRKAMDALTGNGLAWSPDNRTLYWADTSSHVVHAWDYDLPANTMTAHRVHLQLDAKPAGWDFTQTNYPGRPDGAGVDIQGHYHVAMYEGRQVRTYAPDGVLVAQWDTPAQCPTMPCFGGEDGKTLYLTTARQGRSGAELESYPHSGGVFAMRVNIPGLPVNFFVE